MNKKDRVHRVVDEAEAAMEGVKRVLSCVWAYSDDIAEWRGKNVPALRQAQAMLAIIEIALGDARVAAIKVTDEMDQREGDE